MTQKLDVWEKEELRATLRSLITDILRAPPNEIDSLVAQGLDSLDAENLVEALQELGLTADYEFLIEDATLDSLLEHVRVERPATPDVPVAPAGFPETIPLTGAQSIWAELEEAGWQDWANISLCLSVPKTSAAPAWLAAMLQVLCDRNEALRMVLVRQAMGIQQRSVRGFQLPVEIRPAPPSDREIMRLFEGFEGEVVSPFRPSARALVLAANKDQDRHWLCLTIHHVFADRVSMHSLERQFKDLLSRGVLERQSQEPDGFLSYAHAQAALESRAEAKTLSTHLSNAAIQVSRPRPVLSKTLGLSLGNLPTTGYLQRTEAHALETCARELETTLPLLLHALFSAVAAQLTAEQGTARESYPLLCHVVSNRQHSPKRKDIVGCLDTSVPVAPRLAASDTLRNYCADTRLAFAQSVRLVSDLPRGDWLDGPDPREKAAALFERVPHINIVRQPQRDSSADAGLGVQEHPIRRTQRPRWGLLLRASLPPSEKQSGLTGAADDGAIRLSTFAEDRALAIAAHFCLTQALRHLIGLPQRDLQTITVHQLLETVLEVGRFAGQQVARASALVANTPAEPAFIYERLIERQRRWYAHDGQLQLLRDADNRFISRAANPFPFTQLDKLQERAYLEELGAPLPKLLHVLSKDSLQETLPRLAPSLPDRFVMKPVGAGHSFGVTVVRDGLDLTRNRAPFDPHRVGAELSCLAARGHCVHQGKTFRFNFSAFLIENLVDDACGFDMATDYKVFMIGSELLWIQLHFRQDGHAWVAFLDADFRLLAQPCWDPQTCWKTHRALVCTEQSMVAARRPDCWDEILEQSTRLATHMGIFVRLDWYADATEGPLMGEITTFPHMLQPRSFYSASANARVRQLWREPDGVAQTAAHGEATHARVENLLAQAGAEPIGLAGFLPPGDPDQPWSIGDGVGVAELRSFLQRFDLAPWGVHAGARVALLLPNGTEAAAILLATMNRYVAVPLGNGLPADFLADQLRRLNADAVIVLADTQDAKSAKRLPNVTVIEMRAGEGMALPGLPTSPKDLATRMTPLRGLDEPVLVLQTSGTTGAPKAVVYDLARLMRAGSAIALSLDLAPGDCGLSVLPLHHVGGITCNLIAPLLSGAPMRFLPGFDPRHVFTALAGEDGARWLYMVPSLWREMLSYAGNHPDLAREKPWPNLRALRNAGADLPHEMALALSELFGETVHILPTYGMTEAMPIAAPPPRYRLERPNTVGPVLEGVKIEIVSTKPDGGTERLPDGSVGEITLRGPAVINHYEQSDETPVTERGFFRTGDLGCLAADGSGWLSVRGRVKEAINRGGETLSPWEIEAVMLKAPALDARELLVFARAHRTLGQDVGLAVTGDLGTLDFAELQSWAATRLPEKLLPRTLLTLRELPRSATGKLLRAQVANAINTACPPAELAVSEVYDGLGDVPALVSRQSTPMITSANLADAGPVSIEAVMEAVRTFLPESLALEPDTHLVDAGINSLTALELALLLNKRFGADLPNWAVSDHPTPRALTALLMVSARGSPLAAQPPQPALPTQSLRRPLRVLFLHGEASDAALAERSLQATFWTSALADRIAFVFMDAPHRCPPRPELHEAAVVAGQYAKPGYRSWGSKEAHRLDRSLEAVSQALRDLGPVDGIAGVCDGAFIAALIAAKHPEMRLFLNMAAGPPSDSARSEDWAINLPSLHLISPQDSLHPMEQLMEVPGRCEQAFIFRHGFGHAIPPFKGALKDKVKAALDLVQTGEQLGDPPSPKDADSAPMIPPGQANAQTKAAVRDIMEQILGRSDFGATEDFFDLGGNSLSAMQLSLNLEERLGTKLPLETFSLETASVERLADAVAYHAADRRPVTLVPMNSSAKPSVIYALPTLGGHLSDYIALRFALEPYAHLKGVRFGTLLSNDPEASITLDDMARTAAEAIEKDGVNSPIICMGFSIAGIFAFETARHLKLRGHEVSLALIDAEPVLEPLSVPLWKQALRRARGRGRVRKPVTNPHLKPVSIKLREALRAWQPCPVELETVLLCAEAGLITPAHRKLWSKAVTDRIAIEDIPGSHTGIWSQDVAKEVARRLGTKLSSGSFLA